MFKPSRKALGGVALVSMLSVAAVVPSLSAGKTTTKKITCIVQGDPTAGLDVTGKINCPKPLGKGKQTGKLVLPHATGKWTLKGGSFNRWYTTSTIDGGTVKGTVSLSKGTGKFKGCTAKGTQKGPLSTAKIVYKLTLKCK